MASKYKTRMTKLKEVVKIQTQSGNWDANEYMRGMANGLILAESIMEDKEPVYKDAKEDGNVNKSNSER